MTPDEFILRKSLVAAGLSSDKWAELSAGIRDRAFFSSRVESIRFLDTCRTRIAELLANARNADGAKTSRAQVVSDIMRAARESGISTGTERLSDPGSEARANVIIDTNAGLAAGRVRAEIANTYGARLAFPAQELLRIEEREKPRDWRRRWAAAGGHLYAGRMVALKGNPVWVAISRFGVPYPPFDFNSGMGVEDVSYDEAVALGVIDDDYIPPEKSPLKEFNEGLEASLQVAGPRSRAMKELQSIFGDQIQYNAHTRRAYFDGAMIHEVVKQIKAELGAHAALSPAGRAGLGQLAVKAKPSVGCPSPMFIAKTGLAPDPDRVLRLSPSNLLHVLQDHVGVDKDPNNNIPLTERELDLIGHIWRSPETVTLEDDGHWQLTKKAFDAGVYRLFVSIDPNNGGLVFHTFFKTKK